MGLSFSTLNVSGFDSRIQSLTFLFLFSFAFLFRFFLGGSAKVSDLPRVRYSTDWIFGLFFPLPFFLSLSLIISFLLHVDWLLIIHHTIEVKDVSRSLLLIHMRLQLLGPITKIKIEFPSNSIPGHGNKSLYRIHEADLCASTCALFGVLDAGPEMSASSTIRICSARGIWSVRV